jgi:hypothetical protein
MLCRLNLYAYFSSAKFNRFHLVLEILYILAYALVNITSININTQVFNETHSFFIIIFFYNKNGACHSFCIIKMALADSYDLNRGRGGKKAFR